jgi:hypothetical protein
MGGPSVKKSSLCEPRVELGVVDRFVILTVSGRPRDSAAGQLVSVRPPQEAHSPVNQCVLPDPARSDDVK